MVVWVVMYYRRISEIQSRGLTVKTRADLDLLSPAAVNSSNNLQNHFEPCFPELHSISIRFSTEDS